MWGIAALILVARGKKDMKSIETLPQTKATLKEDVAWAREQKS